MTKAERHRRIKIYTRTGWRKLRFAALFPLYMPVAIILAALGLRFLPTSVVRHFGNLIDVPALHRRARRTGLQRGARGILLAPRRRVVNRALVDYWREHYTVITNPVFCWLLVPLTWMPFVSEVQSWTDIVFRELRGGPAMDLVNRKHEDQFGSLQILSLKPNHVEEGTRNLERLGVPRDAWWVALHVREAASLGTYLATHRDADINSYFDAARLIVSRGGWVIRVGDPKMSRIPELRGVIDYVHSDVYADWMDIFVMGNCRFFLGANSGPVYLPTVFGRPAAVANVTPLDNGPLSHHDLFIPKLLWSRREGRHITFREGFSSIAIRRAYRDRVFEQHGVELIDSTPDQITALTQEMLDRLDGTASYTEEDERLQAGYKALWLEKTTPHTWGTQSRVGRNFLREQSGLLT